MSVSKGSKSSGRVTNARVGKTETPTGKMPGKSGRDSAVATGTSAGGSTLRYRSGDVKRSTGSFKSYK